MMIEIAPWTCPSCKCAVAKRYCPNCGERALNAGDLTLRGLAHQVLEELTDIDAKLPRSLRYLVTRPGVLTTAYIGGQRRPYVLPFTLFIIANLLFFSVQSFTSANIFSTPLQQQLEFELWAGVAQQLTAYRLASTQTTLALYAPVYNEAVLLNAKSLIILMALCFSIFPMILFCRRGRPFVTHVVFSLHFYAFLLLLFCVALAIAEIGSLAGGPGLTSDTSDAVFSVILLLSSGTYLYIATGTVYGESGRGRMFKVIALTVAVACVHLGYRFVLLPITLYST